MQVEPRLARGIPNVLGPALLNIPKMQNDRLSDRVILFLRGV